MSNSYDPSQVEPKWQEKWEKAKVYSVDLKKAKKPSYNLVMFPYPSGAQLHVGHWYMYGPTDSFARFQRMQGKDVFFPMGFDAFGLPAENYAIKTGIHPAQSIKENVATMIKQFKRMGCMYDWEKSLNTSDPEYYRWTQWLFLQMFKKKYAYQKEGLVNFCPKCQTVLANEQVWDGHCERCESAVIQKSLKQWYWKTTRYAQDLLDGLEDLDWPEKTKIMQKHWIGRSDGAEITFQVDGSDDVITVFTTRPDTLFGATYMVLSPEHPLVDRITTKEYEKSVNAYKVDAANKTELERTDVETMKTGEFTGAFAINPVNGEKLPIWVADYVIMGYGEGAIMAVPAHDERDFDFACQHGMNDQIKCVIEPDKTIANFWTYVHPGLAPRISNNAPEMSNADDYGSVLQGKKCWTGPGRNINSDFLDGLDTEEAISAMIGWLREEKKGKGVIQYRLRDWCISRQRYWGALIPVVYDPEGTAHPIPEEHLPWELPTDVEFKPTGTSPIAESKELKERTEKLFGKGWTPEVDTMDTFVCSSFYQFRFLAEGNKKELIPKDVDKKWMPVDTYIGGPEHACMHLIYARFVTMVLHELGYAHSSEPFQRLVHQGLITNQGAKMSKSKENVVSPDTFVERHGSDVFRMYLMFMGPYSDGGDWSDTGIKGIDRFAQRVYSVITGKVNKKVDQDKAVTVAFQYGNRGAHGTT